MEFKKIQLTKAGTLNVTYTDADSNTITLVGANIVHRDLRNAVRALIPHLAILTEQREAAAAGLEELRMQEQSVDGYSVYKILGVDDLNFSDGEIKVSVSGTRILRGGKIMKVSAPKINIDDEEAYEYCGELQLVLDEVKFEAKEYIEQKKWGIKQAELFTDDPFKDVQPESVQSVTVTVTTDEPKKKRGRKPKTDLRAVV